MEKMAKSQAHPTRNNQIITDDFKRSSPGKKVKQQSEELEHSVTDSSVDLLSKDDIN